MREKSLQTLSEADRRIVAACAADCEDEIRWQIEHMSTQIRAALQTIPPIDEISSGPLGPGFNTSGQLGTIIRMLQARIAGAKM